MPVMPRWIALEVWSFDQPCSAGAVVSASTHSGLSDVESTYQQCGVAQRCLCPGDWDCNGYCLVLLVGQRHVREGLWEEVALQDGHHRVVEACSFWGVRVN